MSFEKKITYMNDSLQTKRTGRVGNISFFQILALVFITLKLTGVISWSWLWVLSPLWIPFAVALLIIFIWLIILYIGEVAK